MLNHLDPRQITIGDRRANLYLGNGPLALEVVEIPAAGRLGRAALTALLKERVSGRAAPVLIVAPWGAGRAAVCGPTESNPIVLRDISMNQVEAVCRSALEVDGRHAAIRRLHQLLPQLDGPVPGLRNGGLFAMQELEHGVPARGDWMLATSEARALRALRGRALIEGLRFATEELPGPAILLMAGDRKTAVAVLLDRPDEIDSASPRFDGTSPVSYALAQTDRENLDWVVAAAGATLRLLPGKAGGRHGPPWPVRNVRRDQPRPAVRGPCRIPLASAVCFGTGGWRNGLRRYSQGARTSMASQEEVLNSGREASSPSRIRPNGLHTRNRQASTLTPTTTK